MLTICNYGSYLRREALTRLAGLSGNDTPTSACWCEPVGGGLYIKNSTGVPVPNGESQVCRLEDGDNGALRSTHPARSLIEMQVDRQLVNRCTSVDVIAVAIIDIDVITHDTE